MKKILAILLSLVMIVGLAACGNSSGTADTTQDSQNSGSDASVSAKEENDGQAADKNTENNSDSTDDSVTQPEDKNQDTKTDASTDKSTDTASGAKKVLVVYYSATGNTKAVAEEIAAQTKGDLFELKPVEEYSDADLDYNDPESRVCKEHVTERLQDVELTETTPEALKDADVVFLGYPIWWSQAAWPVNNFVKNNDFTGKTVIPFCTSASSDIGNSSSQLQKMAGTGLWQFGKRFSSDVSSSDVKNWVESLELDK